MRRHGRTRTRTLVDAKGRLDGNDMEEISWCECYIQQDVCAVWLLERSGGVKGLCFSLARSERIDGNLSLCEILRLIILYATDLQDECPPTRTRLIQPFHWHAERRHNVHSNVVVRL